MLQLIIAALFFIGLHFLVSGTQLRCVIIARIGETRYRALFSVLALAGLVWMIAAYRTAEYIEVWGQLEVLKPLVLVVMAAAFLLGVIGITTPNPSNLNMESLLLRDEPAKGILRITRHPTLWAVALWAFAHLAVNGDAGSLVLFGSLLVLSVAGTASIDAKRKRRFGSQWDRFTKVTSSVPFLAIAQRRNVFRLSELGWWRIVLALLAFALTVHLHGRLFGVSPWL